ncbi:EKC/KEOPS complex subunit GON7-like [Pezoporus wallicus]|uniref:EKC/KEOPS complex subunit GON7-like n=1 Tax=Pezoporus wallicus TaxID=35540 RepID=UPI00254B3B7A|nr:EKC/KEOPS complex subunit GON7-like [Pezoporus wallicus]XP_061320282.1 EKC/KEOPS complex subunit GON7-like [Pezoporus flaviventris]
MELVAELRGCDGETRSVRVPLPHLTERGEAGQLRGLRQSLAELRERVVELLAPLVQAEREAAGGGGPRGDAEDDDDDEQEEDEDDEGENSIGTKANADDPPRKRTRVQQPW